MAKWFFNKRRGALACCLGLLFASGSVAQPPPLAVERTESPVPPPSPTILLDPQTSVVEEPPFTARPTPFPTSLGGGSAGGYGGLGGLGSQNGESTGLGGPGIFWPRVNYSAVWYPDQPVRGQNTDLGVVRQDFSLSMPVWHDGPDSLLVNANLRSILYQTSAFLPDSGRAFPDALWNISMGLTYTRQFQNGWTGGASINIGSASDQPFHSSNELNVGLSAFVRVPSGERNAWMFGAVYSPTGELPFPIPILAYYWSPSDQFSMNIGLPFSIRWRPLDDLQFDLSYVPVRTVHASVSYRLADGLGVYGGFDWTNESYFLADRFDSQERFFYYEKKLTTGVRYDITPRAAIDLSGGYAFDRFFFQGRSYSDSHQDRVDVGNGFFLSFRFQIRF